MTILQGWRQRPTVSRLQSLPVAMGARLRLDVLIPTHNRAGLLERCIASVLRAAPADGLHVHITVICNGCADGSRTAALRYAAAYPGRISVVTERRLGKSKALNAGIAATSGDLVGMIDDDEEVDVDWLRTIDRAFSDPALDFAGGPYRPIWDRPAPAWIPEEYLAVIGGADSGARRRRYSRAFPGILKGGNAVIRRRVLERVGPYAEHLGPGSFARLFSCEDEDMYWRLLESGARGEYFPDLIIFHYISGERLSRRYYRRWCFWRGVSRGLMDRRHPLPVSYLLGLPRFLWGEAGGALLRLLLARRHRAAPAVFTDELRVWDLAGYAYGRHLYTLARHSPIGSRRTSNTSPPSRTAGLDDVELAG